MDDSSEESLLNSPSGLVVFAVRADFWVPGVGVEDVDWAFHRYDYDELGTETYYIRGKHVLLAMRGIYWVSCFFFFFSFPASNGLL